MFRLELLSGVECQRWLVSTNGAVYGHPDRQTAELVARSSRDFPEFLWNYESATTLRAEDEDHIALFLVPSSAPGLRVRLHKHLDLTRRVCAVELAGVSVDSEAMLAGGAALYQRLLGIGAVAIAADSLGGMERHSKWRSNIQSPRAIRQANRR